MNGIHAVVVVAHSVIQHRTRVSSSSGEREREKKRQHINNCTLRQIKLSVAVTHLYISVMYTQQALPKYHIDMLMIAFHNRNNRNNNNL